jgi:hypothetical protein
MKPVIAKRVTICSQCKEEIEPGSDRLDDVIKTPKFYRRIHYHPQCYLVKINDWYEENRDKIVEHEHFGGHPPSNLTEEQRATRQRILARLANLVAYYTNRLNLQASPANLTVDELRQFNNFAMRFKDCEAKLVDLGGLPPRYRTLGIPSGVEEEIKSVSEVAVV